MEIELVGLAGVLLCSAHLCLGFWSGYRLSRGKTAQPAHHIKPPFYLSDMLELIEHSRRLHCVFTPYQHQLPAGLMPAVVEVYQAAESLHQRVSSGPHSPPERLDRTFFPVQLHPSPVIPAPSSLSEKELQSFALEAPCARGEMERDLTTDRRPYTAYQNVAFYSDELPPSYEFEQVQCHDLSVDGVSFLLNRRPEQDRLVISLGTPPELMFMSAKVVSSVLTYRDGDVYYRVGCRFLKRIDPPRYEGNLKLGIVDPLLTTQPILLQG